MRKRMGETRAFSVHSSECFFKVAATDTCVDLGYFLK